VRSLHDRVRKLEQSNTVRVGPWVISNDSTTGKLRATRPGQEVVLDPDEGTATEVPAESVDLSNLVTQDQLGRILAPTGRQSIWNKLYETLTGLLDPLDALGALAEFLQQELAMGQQIANSMWQAIFDDDTGAIDKTADDVAYALRNIPGLNIIGVGAATMVDTVTDIFDSIWRGLTRQPGHGKSAADVANAANNTSTQADTALQVGEWNNAVLGLRNNKSLMEGIDETEEANFALPMAWGVGTEPVAAYAASATAVPVAYWRATETAKKGFISWFGKGLTGVTNLFIDIYRANYTTNTWDLIHTSADLSGMLIASWSYLIYNLPEVARVDVNSGDVLGIAWRVVGSGTHSIAGVPIAGLPAHPNIHPKKPASVRTGSGALTFAATSYTANTVPWFGIGIVEGDTPPPYFAPRSTDLVTPGPVTWPIPTFANYVDVILIGGGGGGFGGNPAVFLNGEGGDAGQWEAETLVRGVDFPAGATSLDFIIGGGGNHGNVNGPGSSGSPTVRNAIPSGKAALTALGGPRGDHQNSYADDGDSPGDFTYNGITYQGGAGGNAVGGKRGNPGTAPGGGGGGGSGGTWGVAFDGGNGARGAAYIVARQS
jgi:hypothetical protein